MTYIIPHLRYGSIIWLNFKDDERGEKTLRYNTERIQRIFNIVAKNMYSLPKNTPNEKLNRVLGNWNIKTLALTTYVRCAGI